MRDGFARLVSGIAAITLLFRLLGFLRETVVASHFGASQSLDAFLLANAVPAFLASQLPEALQLAFVPAFVRASVENESAALRLLRHFTIRFGIIAIAMGALAFLFARALMQLYIQRPDPETERMATVYFRWLLLTIPLTVALGISGALCNARERYYVAALRGLTFNGFTLGFLMLIPGDPMALVWGGIAGLGAQAAVQLWACRLPTRPQCDASAASVTIDRATLERRIFRALLPALICSGVGQTGIAIDRAFASLLPVGGVAALGYASTLAYFPASLFAATVQTVLYSRFIRESLGEGRASESLQRALRWTLLLMAPVAAWIALFSPHIVSFVYQRGRFDAHAVELTSRALVCLAPGLVFGSLLGLLTRYLYAQGRQQVLTWVSLASVGLNIALDWILVRLFGLSGIAMSTSVVITVVACLLMTIADRQTALSWFGRAGWASLLLAAVGLGTIFAGRIGFARLLAELPVSGHLARFAMMMAVTFVSFGAYALFVRAARRPLHL